VFQKTLVFLFLRYFWQISSDFADFWQKHLPENWKQTHGPIHIWFHMFVQYLVNTSNALEHTLRRRLLPVRLVIEPESRNFFKRLFKLLTFQHLSENLPINILAQKSLNLDNFFLSKRELLRRLAAAWSGLVCTSVPSARQWTMWRGRLRACVRTDGRDFKHLLW